MKSKFIGANRLNLYTLYSRTDVGFKGTQIPGIKINENETVLFVNLGDKYDNRLTENGLIHEPRLEKHLLSKPQTISYYLFLRSGDRGDYYYVGVSRSQKKHKNNYNLFDFYVSGIPIPILEKLGGIQPLP